ncbi:MAG: DeoR/GlpR family DNA-binding transcription regulator [Phycisphaerales bacterium JB063]
MLIVDRQQRLLDILQQQRSAQLDDLAAKLGVSASTVRRDLEALEKTGAVRRTHGGAVYTGSPEIRPASFALATRMTEHVPAKEAIGRYAASLVQPNMTVLMDGGSTVILAAKQITARPIQIVTTSLSIAQLFHEDDQAEVILIGGTVYPRTEVTFGPLTLATLADLHADLLLFSLAGIEMDDAAEGEPASVGAFNINLDISHVEQAMIRRAARSVLLMDSSKFGRKSLVRTCGVVDIDQVVSDAGVPGAWIERMGPRLVVVGPEGEPVQ